MTTKVDNILRIEGSKDSTSEAAMLVLCQSEKHPGQWAFDFNRLLPLPESDLSERTQLRYETWGSCFSPCPTETFIDWNEKAVQIRFLTGWAPPLGIYRKLAEIFAYVGVSFTAKYIEQCGSFAGRYEYCNGVLYHCPCDKDDIRKFGIAEFDVWYEGLSEKLENDGYLVED